MSLLHQLSSQTGDRSEYSNRKVVVQCLEDEGLLREIVAGLANEDAAIVGDCAEVLTHVAETHPDWVAPYARDLAPLLSFKTTRVRWEAMHALALVASLSPKVIARLLPQLGELIRHDSSVIVRDYAVDAVGSYAGTSPRAAETACSLLQEALTVWDGKQAGHALNGLANIALRVPKQRDELRSIAERYFDDRRGVVRQAARKLYKATDKS